MSLNTNNIEELREAYKSLNDEILTNYYILIKLKIIVL